jgi:hypothetical protein
VTVPLVRGVGCATVRRRRRGSGRPGRRALPVGLDPGLEGIQVGEVVPGHRLVGQCPLQVGGDLGRIGPAVEDSRPRRRSGVVGGLTGVE